MEWGRAVDPSLLRAELKKAGADVVGVVHAETSTGVINPVKELAAIAREHGALTIVDMVTSLGGHPVDLAGWGVDIAYSCSQKCIGAPSGMSPVAYSGAARARMVKCRSFYLDLKLLEDYWLAASTTTRCRRRLIYALREALLMAEEEGLEARYARHERHHHALVAGIEGMGLSLLPPAGERLWTLNTVRVPAGVDEARRAQDAARHVQPRGRRGARSAGRQDLARRADGRQLHAADAAAVPRGARSGALDAGSPRAAGRRRRGGRGGAAVAAHGGMSGV